MSRPGNPALETAERDSMKALSQGRYLGRDGEAALFDVGLGAMRSPCASSKAISAASR